MRSKEVWGSRPTTPSEQSPGRRAGSNLHTCCIPQPPLLDPKRARIHVPGLKNKPLFHEFGRQKVPLFLTNREFSCVKYTPYFRVFITGIVATRSICTTFNGNREFLPRKDTLFYKNANRAPSSKTTPFFVKSGTRIRALFGSKRGAGVAYTLRTDHFA